MMEQCIKEKCGAMMGYQNERNLLTSNAKNGGDTKRIEIMYHG